MEESSSNNSRVREEKGGQVRNSKGLHLLLRLSRCYPARWNEASLKQLLRDLAIAEVSCSGENAHGVMEEIEEEFLFPLSELCVTQHEKLISFQASMSEKEQKYVSTIFSLQEEKNEIKQGLVRQNMFVETLLQDFDEMGKAMDYCKEKQRHLEQLLEEKESNLQLLISEKKDLLNKIVTLGYDAVLDWAKRESKCQNSMEIGPPRCSSVEYENGSIQNNNAENSIPKTCVAIHDITKIINSGEENIFKRLSLCQEKRPNLVVVTLNGIIEEGFSSLSSVVDSGVLALPSAVVYFWIGVTGRIVRYVSDSIINNIKGSSIGFLCLGP